jgi:hypothetical protein
VCQEQSLVDGIVFVPVDVTSRRNRGPVNFTVPVPDLCGEPPRCLGHDLQSANDRIHGLAIRDEAAKSICAVNWAMALTLSTMSRKRCAGFLEGIHGIAQNAISKQRF